MTTRRRAREIVLQLLYEDDLNPDQRPEIAEQFLVRRMHGNRPLVEFARVLFKCILQNRESIDREISTVATNWSLRRMAAIDRNIIRLGAYEILHTSTPGTVVINEAIELAKRYGDRNSGQFVNGVLDRLWQHREAEQADQSNETAVVRDSQSGANSVSGASSDDNPGKASQRQTDASQSTPDMVTTSSERNA